MVYTMDLKSIGLNKGRASSSLAEGNFSSIMIKLHIENKITANEKRSSKEITGLIP